MKSLPVGDSCLELIGGVHDEWSANYRGIPSVSSTPNLIHLPHIHHTLSQVPTQPCHLKVYTKFIDLQLPYRTVLDAVAFATNSCMNHFLYARTTNVHNAYIITLIHFPRLCISDLYHDLFLAQSTK